MSTTSLPPVVLSTDPVSKSPAGLLMAESVVIRPALSVPSRIKTITGFLQFNGTMSILENAVTLLQNAKKSFEAAGYTVETVRLTTQPFVEYNQPIGPDLVAFLKQLNDLAGQQGFRMNIGSAMLNDTDDPTAMELLKQILTTMPNLESSAIIADTNGIHWKTIALAAELIQYVSWYSSNGEGNFNFAVSAMQSEYSPYFPGTWLNDEGEQFGIGLECSGAVRDILLKDKGEYATASTDLAAALPGMLGTAGTIAQKVALDTSWNGGCGLTTAPGGGDSIAAAVEAYTGERFGGPGTLTALQLINQQIPGIMLPVLQDELLAERWGESAFTLESLLTYATVGANGLDAVPLPGGVSVGQLKRILSDVALMATKCAVPISARLVPAPWKQPGEGTSFTREGVFNTIVQPLG